MHRIRKCQGRLRILAIIDSAAAATQILDELGVPRTPPPPRARDPSTLENEHDPATDDWC